MAESDDALSLQDEHPSDDAVSREIIDGLSRAQKCLPSKYLYDATGSALFDEICELPEYYPTRTELQIMREHGADMAALLGERILLVEFGSGSSVKTRLLLDKLRNPAGYVPVDISRDHLYAAAQDLAQLYPGVPVLPVCADFTQPFDLPQTEPPPAHVAVYFPGSTLGNFEPQNAQRILRQIAQMVGHHGGLLIGLDLKKNPAVLEAAYNDAAGVTAAFNLNLLERLNREFGGDFQLAQFRHRAVYNAEQGRMEMHLLSLADQQVSVAGRRFQLAEGETIHTENSHKYSLEAFAQIAAAAGLQVKQVWMDPEQLFSVQYLQAD